MRASNCFLKVSRDPNLELIKRSISQISSGIPAVVAGVDCTRSAQSVAQNLAGK